MSIKAGQYVTKALVVGACNPNSEAVRTAYTHLMTLMHTHFQNNPAVSVALDELESDPDIWQKPLQTKLMQASEKISKEILLAARAVHTAHLKSSSANEARDTLPQQEAPRRPPIPIRRIVPLHTGILREQPTTGLLSDQPTEPIDKERLAERFYKRGVKYYQNGNYVKAGQRFYRALKLYPEHELARHGYEACRQRVLDGEA